MNDYPKSIAELDLDSVTFPPAAVEAMRRLARSRPWRRSIPERKRKLLRLSSDLSAAYGLAAPSVIFDLHGNGSDQSCYYPASRTIVLRGRNLSAITLTHELYHHIIGASEREVCRHSLALFRRCFPKSWRRLRFDGHMARRNPLLNCGGPK